LRHSGCRYYNKRKENKKSFRFIVVRTKPDGTRTWDTNLLVALEDFKLTEDANNGDDVLIEFKLKQFKEYGVKRLNDNTVEIPTDNPTQLPSTSTPTTNSTPPTTSTSTVARPNESKPTVRATHVVKYTDTLWGIAKKYYGNGAKWTEIYKFNKTAIEADAKKHGKASSSNGHWIWPGLKLQIPAL
jgi:hypothetical protein